MVLLIQKVCLVHAPFYILKRHVWLGAEDLVEVFYGNLYIICHVSSSLLLGGIDACQRSLGNPVKDHRQDHDTEASYQANAEFQVADTAKYQNTQARCGNK